MNGEKVLVFGGSFDPPHVGHMNLLQNAICAVQPHKVLVVPSGTAPHKAASATPGALRAAMCCCFAPLFPGLEISDIELRRPGRSYTADTLEVLIKQYPGAQLYLSIGGDMLESFTTWHRYEEVLAMATLVVQARSDAEQAGLEKAAETLRAQGARVLFAKGPVLPAASSAIRRAVAEGADVSALVPPEALAVIRENHLYLPEDA